MDTRKPSSYLISETEKIGPTEFFRRREILQEKLPKNDPFFNLHQRKNETEDEESSIENHRETKNHI